MNSHNRSFVKGFEKVAEEKKGNPIHNALAGAAGGAVSGAILHKIMKASPLQIPLMAITTGLGAYLGTKSRNKRLDAHNKTAAPAWFYEMNRTMNPLKSMKNQSKIGIKGTKIGKGRK